MTVYVDDFGVPASVTDEPTGRTYKARWSHLLTDQADHTELHELARKIGLQRRWFQAKDDKTPWHWHYDVTASKRKAAVAAGAVAIEWPSVGEVTQRAREAHTQAAGGAPCPIHSANA